ncbi:MAG: glycosyltransferase family 9 protein [Alphaproteobacteria bacterium]
MQILFITSNRVGDAVLSTGLLAWMVESYPNAAFTIACGPYAADLFRTTPRLERLIILKKRKWNLHWLRLWQQCASTEWDLIVDLRDSLISRLLRAQKRAYRVKANGLQHKVITNGLVLDLTPPPAPTIWIDENARIKATELLPTTRPLIALGPAANWPVKQWPIERFIQLAQKLTAPYGALPGAHILLIADEKERQQIAPLLQALPNSTAIIGQDLVTVAACLKEARLFIGNDSGLMHLSAAVGTPTLGLFGPGYEEIYAPWGPRCAVVRTDKDREALLRCLPYQGANAPNLMGSLSVDKALTAAEALLKRS